MIASLKYTHADFLQMPDDGKRREIIGGDLYVTPSPLTPHQRTLLELAFAFRAFLQEHPFGEVLIAPLDVICTEHDVLEPDLLFVLNEQKDILQDWVRGAPDLVVEVFSLNTETRDRGIKLKAYGRFGVAEYWIVDPAAHTVEVYRPSPQGLQLAETCASDAALTTPLLPGFAVPVSSIFRP